MARRDAGGLTRADGRSSEEVEWQLDAPDLGAVERWLESLGSAAPGDLAIDAVRVTRIEDIYLDTEDQRFRRAGYALRMRCSRHGAALAVEATLKALTGGGVEGPRRREELTEPLPTETGAPDTAVDPTILLRSTGTLGRRVQALAGTRPLHEILRIGTDRRTRALCADGAEVAEIAIDRSSLRPTGGIGRRLERVEVELLTDTLPETVERFVGALSKACSLRPADASKLEVGLGRAASATAGSDVAPARTPTPTPAWPPTIRRQAGMAEAARTVLRGPLAMLTAAHPVARDGTDPEGVHDMRVATRRLQAALSLYETALPRSASTLRGELRWLRTELGEVRDLDTRLQRIPGKRSETVHAGGDPGDLEPLRELLRRYRNEARARRLLPALDGARYRSVVAELQRLTSWPPDRAGAAENQQASIALRPALRRRGRLLRKALRRASRHPGTAERHRARIRTKQLRYALECSTSLYGRPARRTLDSLRPLQELLGAERDASLAAAALRSLAAGADAATLPPVTLVAMGESAAHEYRHAQELLAGLPRAVARAEKHWKRLRSARMRARGQG